MVEIRRFINEISPHVGNTKILTKSTHKILIYLLTYLLSKITAHTDGQILKVVGKNRKFFKKASNIRRRDHEKNNSKIKSTEKKTVAKGELAKILLGNR